jgi:hypothetical protein
MPCYSYESSEEEAMRNDSHNKTKQELDTVTRLLCSVLRSIKFGDVYVDLTKDVKNIEGLSDWWNEHKKWDELRLIREANQRKEQEKQQFIKNALAKLTDKEKEALGL